MRTVLPCVRALSPSDAIGFDPEPPVEASKQPTLCCWFRQHFTWSPFLFTLPSSILLLHATVIMPSIRVCPQKFTSTCLPLGAGARLGRLGSAPPIRAPCTQQSWAHARTPGVVCTCVPCVHVCTPAWVNWAQCQWLSCVDRQWICAATPCCLHLCSLTETIKTQLWDGIFANWVSIIEHCC